MTKFMDAGRALLAAFGRKSPSLPPSPNWEVLSSQWQALYLQQEELCATQKAEYEAAMVIAEVQAKEQDTAYAELEQKYFTLEANYKHTTNSWHEEKRKRETLQGNYQSLVEATQVEIGRAEVDAATIARLEKEKWELVEVLAGRERAMKALTEEHGRVLAAKQIAEEVQAGQSEVIATQQQGLLDYERDTRKLQEEITRLEKRLEDMRVGDKLMAEGYEQLVERQKADKATMDSIKLAHDVTLEAYGKLEKLAGRALSLLLHPIGLHQPWPRKRDELAVEMKEAGITEPEPEKG